jgi:hypothetical protein
MPLRLAVFDFDLTLTVEHVFHFLSSRGPPPGALSECGQLVRISELDQMPDFAAQGGLANVMFGGTARIQQIRGMLTALQGAGAECVVCTKGLVGPVRKLLEQAGLSRYFSEVYGNTGKSYGCNDYDATADAGDDDRFLGGEKCQLKGSKQQFLAKYMKDKNLQFNDVVFIDDTIDEVKSMQQTCVAIHVNPPKGMSQQVMDDLCRLAQSSSQDNESSQGRNSASADSPQQFLGLPDMSWAYKATQGSKFPGPSKPLRVGDQVQVWSKSYNAWCPGSITRSDGNSDSVDVQYYGPDGKQFSKTMESNSAWLQQDPGPVCQHHPGSVPNEEPYFVTEDSYGRREKRKNRGPCCTQ